MADLAFSIEARKRVLSCPGSTSIGSESKITMPTGSSHMPSARKRFFGGSSTSSPAFGLPRGRVVWRDFLGDTKYTFLLRTWRYGWQQKGVLGVSQKVSPDNSS